LDLKETGSDAGERSSQANVLERVVAFGFNTKKINF
jgi:hypothetical protein